MFGILRNEILSFSEPKPCWDESFVIEIRLSYLCWYATKAVQSPSRIGLEYVDVTISLKQ